MSKKETKSQSPLFNLEGEIFSIETLDKEIEIQKRRAVRETEILQSLEKEKSEKLKPLRAKIRSGEASTGSQIKDFILIYFGADKEKENQFLDLKEELSQHQGEFVLLKKIEHRAHGHIDFEFNPKPHPELYHWEETASLGVISNKIPLDLDIKSGQIILAPEKHCVINKHQDRKSFLKNDSLSFVYYETAKLGQSIESFYANDRPFFPSIYPTEEKINSQGVKDLAMEILVGDKKVFNYFKNRALLDLYPLALKQLGRELKKLPPESEKALLERKTNIFTHLQEAVEKERSLRKKLEEIKDVKAPKIGDGIHFTDIDEDIEKDIEDMKIIGSIPLSNKHEEILHKIERHLEEALDLEMHQTPWVIKKELDPGKVEFNVPQIIMNYCEYYDFPEIKKRLAKNPKT
ncbi:hypothetical protein FJZ41_03195 [Candidatus Shapirobacteria bacterium]|nr:hypothetical protein [Candidatus Shapirobacteria bacterium]